MADRDKINQYKSIKYAQESLESKKEMKFFQMLRKEVEIGANGTSKYMIKTMEKEIDKLKKDVEKLKDGQRDIKFSNGNGH